MPTISHKDLVAPSTVSIRPVRFRRPESFAPTHPLPVGYGERRWLRCMKPVSCVDALAGVGMRISTLKIALDARRATRGGTAAIAARQQARLAELVAFARTCSPYYRRLYKDLSANVCDPRLLPP